MCETENAKTNAALCLARLGALSHTVADTIGDLAFWFGEIVLGQATLRTSSHSHHAIWPRRAVGAVLAA